MKKLLDGGDKVFGGDYGLNRKVRGKYVRKIIKDKLR